MIHMTNRTNVNVRFCAHVSAQECAGWRHFIWNKKLIDETVNLYALLLHEHRNTEATRI